MEAQDQAERELTFEEAAEQLEQLVRRMESGRMPLQSLITDYERGRRLLAQCHKRINEMRRQMEILTRDTPEGGEWQDFAADGATPSRQGELPL